MLNLRQEDELTLARSYGLTFGRGQVVPPISGEWNQLIYATRGALTVRSDVGTWIVPPHRAVWLPPNLGSVLTVTVPTALRMVYLPFSRALPGFDLSSCKVVNVSGLLRELILRVVQIGALRSDDASHVRIVGLIFDELTQVETVPLQLPYPTSAAGLALAKCLESDGSNLLGALRESGTSRRTMERIFQRETGVSLGRWIRRRKLLRGLDLLLRNETTSSVAFELGYNGPSAFIAMFRRELGATPSSYLGSFKDR